MASGHAGGGSAVLVQLYEAAALYLSPHCRYCLLIRYIHLRMGPEDNPDAGFHQSVYDSSAIFHHRAPLAPGRSVKHCETFILLLGQLLKLLQHIIVIGAACVQKLLGLLVPVLLYAADGIFLIWAGAQQSVVVVKGIHLVHAYVGRGVEQMDIPAHMLRSPEHIYIKLRCGGDYNLGLYPVHIGKGHKFLAGAYSHHIL